MPKISFKETGNNGPVLLLIHGFPMNKNVWEAFIPHLSNSFKVIAIDLPGFGDSPILDTSFSINDVADEIIKWLREKKINNCIMIGHSLGGYVTLALAEKKPETFAGIGLFHSTAYADSSDKKTSRTKVIEFIEKNGVLAFTSNFIQGLFVDQAHPSIEKVRDIAIQSSQQTVIGYTKAMRDRPDRIQTLQKFNKPILFLAGEHDAGIAVSTILDQAALIKLAEVQVLKGVSHMGMFEAPEETSRIISDFAVRCSS